MRTNPSWGAAVATIAWLSATSIASGDTMPADSTRALADTLAARVDSVATAQTAAPAPARGVRDTVTVLPPINVEGQRRPLDDRRSATTMRLDRAQVARFLPRTAADALVTAPGVELIKTGPWASRVSYRGFEGERVLVMVDGVRLNTGRGHGSNASLVSVDRIDQIELSAGAAGAEFGSDAIGGVVNMVTHRPLFTNAPAFVATISASGEDPGDRFTQQGKIRFMSRGLGAEVWGGMGHQNELVTPTEHVPNSGSHDGDLGARAAATLGAARLDVEHSEHRAHDVGLPAVNGRYPVISREANRAEVEALLHPSARGASVPLGLKLLASDQRYRTDFDEVALDTVVSSRTRQPIAFHHTLAQDRVVTRSRQLLPEMRFGEHGELRLGGEWRNETTSGPKTSTVTTTSTTGEVTDVSTGVSDNVPNARREVRAGSVATRLAWGRARVEGGARYDWYRSFAESTATSWSPALDVIDERASLDGGVAARLGAIEPYGRVASGFRVPNLEERYYRGPVHGAILVYGNPALVPERNVTYEAGVRADGERWGSARVSAYRTESEDFISLSYIPLARGTPSFIYRNLERVQIDGLEGAAQLRFGWFKALLSGTLPRGRDLATGDPVPEVGAARASLDLIAPVGGWAPSGILSLRTRWCDGLATNPLRQAEEGVLSRPAFWTADAELGATLAGARLTFAVRNLANTQYREPLSFIDEPGRTYSFAFKRDFLMPLSGGSKERP